MSPLAATALAVLALSTSPDHDRRRTVLLGELAFMFGGCERYFTKDQADKMVRSMTGAGVENKSDDQRLLGQIWAESYSKGRQEKLLNDLGPERCLGLVSDVLADLKELDAARP